MFLWVVKVKSESLPILDLGCMNGNGYEGRLEVGINAYRTLKDININPYPTAFPYGNGMVLHFYQQQESSTNKTVHKVINKGLKTYV